MEIYQDRICFLAGEENGLGRFLKEHGKSDKTRAGKMMVAAGKTMSYTGQQRLAIRCVGGRALNLKNNNVHIDGFNMKSLYNNFFDVLD